MWYEKSRYYIVVSEGLMEILGIELIFCCLFVVMLGYFDLSLEGRFDEEESRDKERNYGIFVIV